MMKIEMNRAKKEIIVMEKDYKKPVFMELPNLRNMKKFSQDARAIL